LFGSPDRKRASRVQETFFMIRIISLLGAIGLATLFVAACGGEDTTVITAFSLTPGGAGGVAGRASSGGTATSNGGDDSAAGSGVAGGASGGSPSEDAGPDASGPDAGPVTLDTGDAGLRIPCVEVADCDDQNLCTTESCPDGFCSVTPVAIGTPCGDTASVDECTQPDTCDASGVCLPNNQPEGTLCADGHCSLTGVCDCAVDRITTVPYQQQWQTTADTEIDLLDLQPCQLCDGTPDHVVVFTAPAAATYRLTATSIAGGAELTVFQGDCGAAPADLVCGENIDPESDDLNDQLELTLDAGDSVTVVVGEECEENGSEGILSIEVVPEEP
jgi:hypothetical protein